MARSPTSSAASAPLPAFELRPSRWLAGGMATATLAGLAPALLLPGLPGILRGLWAGAVLLEAARSLDRHWPPLHGAIRRLAREVDGRWRLEDGRGRVWSGPAVDVLVHPRLCVLRVGHGFRGRTVVLLADSCSAEQHRRVRRALRSGADGTAA